MRRRWLVGLGGVLVVAALAGPRASAQEGPTTSEPVPTTTAVISEGESLPAEGGRNVSGTIEGIDGRAVNAQISMVLRDSLDRPIRMNGQVHDNRGEYAALVSMNPGAPIDGLAAGGDRTWQITGLPSNAHHLTLEVYPRQAGSGAGVFSHYGGAVKRNLRILPGQSLGNVRIVFPLNCNNVPGGTTGSIRIRHFVNGQPVGNLDNFVATGADFPAFGIQGFRDQRDIPAGEHTPEFDGLAPDRRYGVEIFVDPPGGGRRHFTFFEVPVRACQRTDVILTEGSPSARPPRFARRPVSATGPGFPVPGDFDGDGDDDIYFAAPNGGSMWTSNGSGYGFSRAAMPSSGTHRVVAGDFDGDDIDDLFFYGGGARPDRVWDFDGTGTPTVVPTNAAMGGSQTYPVVGDFDDNRRADILFVSPTGGDTLRRHTAAGFTDRAVDIPNGFTVRAGDFDGDWQADLFLYRPLRDFGEFEAWQTRPNGVSWTRHTYRLQPAQFQMVVGDVSGDFKSDIVFYQPGAATDVLWRGRAPEAPYFTRETANLGITGNFVPVMGDFNGDGTDDTFFYGPGGAADQIWRSNGPAWLVQQNR